MAEDHFKDVELSPDGEGSSGAHHKHHSNEPHYHHEHHKQHKVVDRDKPFWSPPKIHGGTHDRQEEELKVSWLELFYGPHSPPSSSLSDFPPLSLILRFGTEIHTRTRAPPQTWSS